MISLEYQILLAVTLDILLGDPRWLPHPVRLIGRFALWVEPFFRKWFTNLRLAGICTVCTVLAVTAIVVSGMLQLGALVHPLAHDVLSILLLYTTIAMRDLIKHSRDVYLALKMDDLSEARRRVGYIVGRDTENLDKEEISKATIESVAENMVDGITAPLFFAVLGGPLAAMLYKAINTLDSTFGYKNEKYIHFGWAAARLDDLANFLPARITGGLAPLGALFTGLSFQRSLKIFLRDRFNHASPNSAHTEAGFAGAFGIRLGGPTSYFGKLSDKPTIGDAVHPLFPKLIPKANLLMGTTSLLTLAFLLAIRLIFIHAV